MVSLPTIIPSASPPAAQSFSAAAADVAQSARQSPPSVQGTAHAVTSVLSGVFSWMADYPKSAKQLYEDLQPLPGEIGAPPESPVMVTADVSPPALVAKGSMPERVENAFKDQLAQVKENLIAWVPLYLIEEFGLKGFGLHVQKPDMPPNFYQTLMTDPNSGVLKNEDLIRKDFFKSVDASTDSKVKRSVIKNILYDFLRACIKSLLEDISEKLEKEMDEFIALNSKKDDFVGVSTERLELIIEFLTDLERNYRKAAEPGCKGGTVPKRVLGLFHNPPKNENYNVEMTYEEFFTVLPGILSRKFTPTLHFAEDFARDIIKECGFAEAKYADGNSEITQIKNFFIDCFNIIIKYFVNPLVRFVVTLVCIIPWLTFAYLPQAIANWQIKRNITSYIRNILQGLADNSSRTEDMQGYTYAIDTMICDLLNTIITAIENSPAPSESSSSPPLQPNSHTSSTTRDEKLRLIVNMLWGIAPLALIEDPKKLKEALKEKDDFERSAQGTKATQFVLYHLKDNKRKFDHIEAEIRAHTTEAGVTALNAMIQHYLKDNELKAQLAKLLAKFNNSFKPNHTFATEKEKKDKIIEKNRLNGRLIDVVLLRATGNPWKSYLVKKCLGIEAIIEDRLKGLGNLVAQPVTWKFGLYVYVIGKPYLQDNKIKV